MQEQGIFLRQIVDRSEGFARKAHATDVTALPTRVVRAVVAFYRLDDFLAQALEEMNSEYFKFVGDDTGPQRRARYVRMLEEILFRRTLLAGERAVRELWLYERTGTLSFARWMAGGGYAGLWENSRRPPRGKTIREIGARLYGIRGTAAAPMRVAYRSAVLRRGRALQ